MSSFCSWGLLYSLERRRTEELMKERACMIGLVTPNPRELTSLTVSRSSSANDSSSLSCPYPMPISMSMVGIACDWACHSISLLLTRAG